MTDVAEPFRVGFSPDFFRADGSSAFGEIGFGMLDRTPGIEWRSMGPVGRELTPADVAPFDALALFGQRVTAGTLSGNERLALVARYGVGLDNVDLPACTRHGVVVTTTPGGVRRPMAAVNLTFLLALGHRLLEQDRLIRAGRWAEKFGVRGTGLTGQTLGLIGLGNIAREFLSLAAPLGMRHIAADPYAAAETAASLGVELVGLEDLLVMSDFVVVACALTPETHHLLNAERLARMKPTAYLISTARGAIVDQAALVSALTERRIAGAGLDVFEQEPIAPDDPILALDNVILSPHNLGLTDEWARVSGEEALGGVLEMAAGRLPSHVANRDVLGSPLLLAKLQRFGGKAG